MPHIILFQPEIPQNTGNIARSCACTGTTLHLIKPLGFKLEDRYLKRSAMDYWQFLDLHVHENWEQFLDFPTRPQCLWLLSTKATKSLWEANLSATDGFILGQESAGCPSWLHEQIPQKLKIPMFNAHCRSLNLASSAAITLYECLRQSLKMSLN